MFKAEYIQILRKDQNYELFTSWFHSNEMRGFHPIKKKLMVQKHVRTEEFISISSS